MNTFPQKIKKFMERHQMPEPGTSVLVALSGGIDSMVLLNVLCSLGYKVEAAHINHSLRGERANADASFCEAAAKKLNVPFHLHVADVKSLATEKGISVEMAGREVRYAYFNELLLAGHGEFLATGHHADDHAETMLINLVRGSGLSGLTGIKPVMNRIIRPLLGVQRSHIESYAKYAGIAWITDESNTDVSFVRNRFRHNILPEIKKVNPAIVPTLAHTAQIMTEAQTLADMYYAQWQEMSVAREGDNIRVAIEAVTTSPTPLTLLHALLSPLGFSPDTIHRCANPENLRNGSTFYADKYVLLVDRGFFVVEPITELSDVSLTIDADETDFVWPFSFSISVEPIDEVPNLIGTANELFLDADKLTWPLTLRRWKHGDRFIPLGMSGFKKISDFFTDLKLSVTDKEKQWLLCSGNDIVWVVAHRPDNRYRVTESTQNVLCVIIR